MIKKEFRVLIKHCFLMEKSTVQAKQWFDKCYPDSVPGKSTIIVWYAEFKRGCTSTDDAECFGRLNEAVIWENIEKIQEVFKDHKVKWRELADMLKISVERVRHIFHTYLSMRKLCSKWICIRSQRTKKRQRVYDSEAVWAQ